MEFILPVVVFLFGAAIGSFLNVLIDRLPAGRPIFKSRSVCDSCHKKLSPLELIPIISYIALGGKCKHCHAKIPPRLLLVELLTGILFVATFIFLNSQFSSLNFSLLILILVAICANIAIFFTDFEYGVIPDELIIIFTLAALISLTLFNTGQLILNFVAAFSTFALFLFLFLVTRGKGMGFGDVKYSFAMGLFLGFPAIISGLYFAFLTGATISLALVAYRKKKLKSTIPFGPFLTAGTIFAYFYGEKATSIFTSFFMR